MSKPSIALEKAIESVKERSQADALFRALAVKDARAALRQIGYEGEVTVLFTDGPYPAPSAQGFLKVDLSPARPEGKSEELSEADLEQVSGGGDGSGVTWNP
jgi:hypothetical protein